MENLPEDPIMLMSVINTRLRDEYPSLDELCSSLDINPHQLTDKLEADGFVYMPDINQFR